MADIKDIMGIKASAKAPAAKKQKTAAEKKPDGISREAWQIMRDNQQTDALASVVPTHAGLKDKRKVSARKVSWSWQPFKNSARTDNLMLRHWVKTGTGGTLLPGSNGGDVGGDAEGVGDAEESEEEKELRTGAVSAAVNIDFGLAASSDCPSSPSGTGDGGGAGCE